MAAILKTPKSQVIETGFYDLLLKEMRARFIKVDQMTLAIALILVGKRNGIFWGPPGHGKSEMTEAALRLVQEQKGELFLQSCDQAMTPERMFGGIDLNAMDDETNKRIEFYLDNSFLPARFTVFEEGLDCPEQTLTALKDTLTRKVYINGRQQGVLKNESILINTNKEPKEFNTLGDTTQAFLDRFVIQFRVVWDSYLSSDYLELGRAARGRSEAVEVGLLAQCLRDAQKLYQSSDITDSENVLALLAERAGQIGTPLSPRTYLLAQSVASASAAIRGRSVVKTQDLQALAFLPSISAIDNLMQFIREADAADEANRLARNLFKQFNALTAEIEDLVNRDEYDQVNETQKRLAALNQQIKSSGMSDAVQKLKAEHEAREQAARAANVAAA